MKELKVCYLPGRESSYARTRVLLKGMRDAGIEVFDCSYPKRNSFRYVVGFYKFLLNKKKSDVIFIGFFGHLLVPLVKIFTRKKIVFDVFVSAYQTIILERKSFKPNGLMARLFRFIDKFSCNLADIVLIDTEQHKDYFLKEYLLDEKKFFVIPASADESVMHPYPEIKTEEFLVHFHGEVQGMHGVEYIFEAASMLPDIHFQLILKRKGLAFLKEKKYKVSLDNVTIISPVSYEKLAEYMAKASICLGIFGDTQKAQLVIPNKIYEALAMEKAVITSKTPAIATLFANEKNMLLCELANAESLAEAIRRLKEDTILREKIANNGRKTFEMKCLPVIHGRKISTIFTKFL